MGKKHRDKRKAFKAEERKLRAQGWRENEHGELHLRMSKAEARRRFIRGVIEYYEVRLFNIIDRVVQKAKEDIQAQEDARVFEVIDRAL